MDRERRELETDVEHEKEELTAIYVGRGLKQDLARQVAEELMTHDALGAHARDELGISDITSAKPVQAAFASAGTFALGAALPLAVAALIPETLIITGVAGTSLCFLALLGGLAAGAGGARISTGIVRVTFWGAIAMVLTAGVGALFGTVI